MRVPISQLNVGVRIDQAGQHYAARCVHHLINAFVRQVKPDGRDLFADQQQVTTHFARWSH